MTNYRLGSAESLQRITIPLVRLLFYHASLFIKKLKFEEYLFLIALMACNRRVLNFHRDAENRLKVVLNKLLRC